MNGRSEIALRLFFGDDQYSMGRAVEAATVEGHFEPVDVVRIDTRKSGPAETLMVLATAGLFTPRRLVILEGLEEVARAPRKPAAKTKKAEGDALSIARLLQATPDSTTLIILGSGMRADAPLMKEARGCGDSVEVREFRAPRQKEMPRWIAQRAREQGIELEPRAAEALAIRVGEQVAIAGVELAKLGAASAPTGKVGREMVEALVPSTAEESIFPLVEAIASRRREAALQLLERQLTQEQGRGMDLPLRLIRLVARQFRLLLHIRLLRAEGKARDEIVSTLRLPDYFADRYFAQARNTSEVRLGWALERLAATEQSIKNGEARELYLHLLIAELTESDAPLVPTA